MMKIVFKPTHLLNRACSLNHRFWPTLFLYAALVTGLVAPAAPAPADAQGLGSRPSIEADAQAAELITVQSTLYSKAPREVADIGRQRYVVRRDTLIVDMDGQRLTINQLLVPCDVEITYRRMNGERQARRISVLRVASDATSGMMPGSVAPR